jgi:dTDP-4-amino-4,6-dideoxygalactose transaminase
MDWIVNFSGRGHKYTQEEMDTVVSVMQNAQPLTQGKHRDEFENKFCEYNKVSYAYSMCNATAALEVAAQLCLFKKGDELIAPSHTFTSSVYPFIKKGASVVWADIDPLTGVVTPQTIEKCITKKTKAIVVVHLYGYMADISGIMEVARKHDLLVIEDVAQAMGTDIDGKMAGTFGDFSIFSFHSHKNITTLGEGGILSVRDKKYADLIPMLRHNGHCGFNFQRENYWIPAMGNVDLPVLDGEILMPNNYCLGEVECALGVKLLNRLDQMNKEKRGRAVLFIKTLEGFNGLQFHLEDSTRHNYHLLVAQVSNGKRDEFIKKMSEEKKIQCVVQYYPLNRYDLYKKLGYGKADCLNADIFFDNMVSFPFHHWMSDKDFQYVLDSTSEISRELRL